MPPAKRKIARPDDESVGLGSSSLLVGGAEASADVIPKAKAPRKAAAPKAGGGLLTAASRVCSSRGRGGRGRGKLPAASAMAVTDGETRCRCCLAVRPELGDDDTAVQWCSQEVQGEEDKCRDCEAVHETVKPMTWSDFCAKYHESPTFKEDVSKAARETLTETRGASTILERTVLALTAADMKSAQVQDPEKTYPTVTIPNLKGAPTTWFLAQDPRMPFHTLSVKREVCHRSANQLVDSTSVLFEGQTAQQLNKYRNEHMDQTGATVLHGSIPALPGALVEGPLRMMPAGLGAAGGCGLTAAAVAALGGSPDKTGPGSVAASMFSMPPPSTSPAAKNFPLARAPSVASAASWMLRAPQGGHDDCSRSGGEPPGLVEKKSGEDIRKMNAHQKAQYWTGRISVHSALIGEVDRKSLRQGADHIERNAGTSDATLKELINVLEAKVRLATLADAMSPDQVVTITDEETYRANIQALKGSECESGWLTVVEAGMVKRRLLLLRGNIEESLQFLRVITPWTADVDLLIFDPLQPLLCACGNSEAQEASLFSSLLVHDLVSQWIEKGPGEILKVMCLAEQAIDQLIASQEGAELSELSTSVLLDAISCLRAVHSILAPKITFQILKDKNIRATKRMSEVAKNLQDTSILAMVGRLIMKSDCYMAPMLALYMESSDALLKHSTDLQNAWSFAKGIPQ
ncbi:unnamed protein product, partial [Prorocentrum cordatum]